MNNNVQPIGKVTEATNGIGWDIQEMPAVAPEDEAPKGWKWVSEKFQDFHATKADLLRMPDDTSVDRRVYERLIPRKAA